MDKKIDELKIKAQALKEKAEAFQKATEEERAAKVELIKVLLSIVEPVLPLLMSAGRSFVFASQGGSVALGPKGIFEVKDGPNSLFHQVGLNTFVDDFSPDIEAMFSELSKAIDKHLAGALESRTIEAQARAAKFRALVNAAVRA